MRQLVASLLVIVCGCSLFVNGHAVITSFQGTGGPEGRALGVLEDTPRDGTKLNPFQRDTSIILGGRGCGLTLAGGRNDMKNGPEKLASELGGLPEVTAGQPMTMTIHQVNADGGGPFNCAVSQDGTAQGFKKIPVTQNVKGFVGLSPQTQKKDHELKATMPEGMKCTGGAQGNMCMVRCTNTIGFGGCVPVQMGAGGGENAGAAADQQAGQAAGEQGAATGAGEQKATGQKKKQSAGKADAAEGSNATGGGGGGVRGLLGGLLSGAGGGGKGGGAAGLLGALGGLGKK